jgi:hypothetical protein
MATGKCRKAGSDKNVSRNWIYYCRDQYSCYRRCVLTLFTLDFVRDDDAVDLGKNKTKKVGSC